MLGGTGSDRSHVGYQVLLGEEDEGSASRVSDPPPPESTILRLSDGDEAGVPINLGEDQQQDGSRSSNGGNETSSTAELPLTSNTPCSNYGTVPATSTTSMTSSSPQDKTSKGGHLTNFDPRVENRTLGRKGLLNLKSVNIQNLDWPFLADIFTTFLDGQWRWLLLTIGLLYFGTWLGFAGIWYLILYLHNDFEPQNIGNPNWVPCVTQMKDFTSTFLFSVETQQTTGYGFYHITEQCPIAVFTLGFQSIIGVILEGLLVGLVFVKVARSKKRTATLVFSRTAVICKRDGQLCFMFRVGDMRNKSRLLSAKVRAQLIRKRITLEGEEIPIAQEELKVGGDGEKGNKLLLYWPTLVVHRITQTSPLYNLSESQLRSLQEQGSFSSSSGTSMAMGKGGEEVGCHFEIMVLLEGIVEGTGLMTQAKSSYIPSEIQWNHRFKNVFGKFKSRDGTRNVDFSAFHETFPVQGHGKSAKEMDMELELISTKESPGLATRP